MPLQIRRGPTPDRLAITPLAGELVYDTDTGAVFVGDGETAGGVAVTAFSAADARIVTAKMFLGESLNDNANHNGITFQYINNELLATVQLDLTDYLGTIGAEGFKGSLFGNDSSLAYNANTGVFSGIFRGDVLGSIYSDGSSLLYDATEGRVFLSGNVASDITPITNEAYDLGSSAFRFRDIWLSGSSIHLGNALITASGTVVDLPVGSTIGGESLAAAVGNFKGSVFGDDSTLLINGVDSTINLNGTVKGNIVPFTAEVYNLGSALYRFNTLYLKEGSSLHIGTAVIEGTSGAIDLPAGSTVNGSPITTSAGSNATSITLYSTSTNTPHYVPFFDSLTGDETPFVINTFNFNPNTGTLGATKFSGDLYGASFGTHNGIVNGEINGSLKGSVFGEDSTLIVDASDGKVYGSLVGNVVGNVTGDIFGVVIGTAGSSMTGNVTGNIFGVVTGTAGSSLIGTVTGSLSGEVNGSLRGSVFGEDSTLIVDAVDARVYATLVGNVIGNVTGNVFGNTTGIITGTAGSSLIGTVTGNVLGTLVGDVKGTVTGDDSTILVDGPGSRLVGPYDNGSLAISGGFITSSLSIPGGSPGNRPLYIGTTTNPASPNLYSNDSDKDFIVLNGVTNGSNSSGIVIGTSRGTVSVPTTVVVGDPVALIYGDAYNGSSNSGVGFFGLYTDPNSSISAGIVPGAFVANVQNNTGAVQSMSFDSKGVLNAPVVKLTNYATGSLPSGPEKGWMAFDSTTNQFKGWNGSAWVVLG